MAKKRHKNKLLEKMNEFPPILCRLVARDGNKFLNKYDLAKRSGLNVQTIHRLTWAVKWDKFTTKTAFSFALACGVNPFYPARHIKWLKHGDKKAWKSQRHFYNRLLERVRKWRQENKI